MNDVLPGYASIRHFGHGEIKELLDGPVIVEEKVDGSQLSFGLIDGKLRMRSKGAPLDPDAAAVPQKMFIRACESVKERASSLRPGYIYRGEYLRQPKHNTLAYNRHPNGFIVIFDVSEGPYSWVADPAQKAELAAEIGLETVPLLHSGIVDNFAAVEGFLERTSFLGGQRIEGVVIKNYARFTGDGKPMMGKYVREDFKELNNKDFRLRNPAQSDIILALINRYKVPARWEKAAQHLRERGELEHSPRDIPKVIRETQEDILRECGDEIKEALFKWATKKILGGAVGGLPEWWKQKLAEGQFGDG